MNDYVVIEAIEKLFHFYCDIQSPSVWEDVNCSDVFVRPGTETSSSERIFYFLDKLSNFIE